MTLRNSLKSIGEKPHIWFGCRAEERSLLLVQAFITGYRHGQQHPDDRFPIEGFTEWIASRYQVNAGPNNGFGLIEEKVGGDQKLAFDEFFSLLPVFVRDTNS